MAWRIHTTFLALAAVAVTACNYDPNIDAQGFPCSTSRDCPLNFFCEMTSGETVGACSKFLSHYSQVSAGDGHTCGMGTDGTLVCWGDDSYGQATPPDGTFLSVSAGEQYACALKTDHTAVCWGGGQTAAPPPQATFLSISAGEAHTCGVMTDNTISCWGSNVSSYSASSFIGQATPPEGTFLSVSAGLAHTCALKTDRTIACWGAGDSSGAGGSFLNHGQALPPEGTFADVSSGGTHTCGVKTDGTIVCWGEDLYDEPPAGVFSSVSSGYAFSCAVGINGHFACWGDGDADDVDYYIPLPVGNFTTISAGLDGHACGIRDDGSVTCWGYNTYGEATPPKR